MAEPDTAQRHAPELVAQALELARAHPPADASAMVWHEVTTGTRDG